MSSLPASALSRGAAHTREITHEREAHKLLTFCQIISRQLRRLTGLSGLRVATSATPATHSFAHPSASRAPRCVQLRVPGANFSNVSGATWAGGVPAGDGRFPDQRLLATDLEAPSRYRPTAA